MSDPKQISNIFNDYVSTLGSKIEQKMPFVQENFQDYFNKESQRLLLINSNKFEEEKLIVALDLTKSIGPNGIPIFILKILGHQN